jgi:hypothetical protein
LQQFLSSDLVHGFARVMTTTCDAKKKVPNLSLDAESIRVALVEALASIRNAKNRAAVTTV